VPEPPATEASLPEASIVEGEYSSCRCGIWSRH
jgi:hypothetical protein